MSPTKDLITKSKVEVTASMLCGYYINGVWTLKKCYHGQSSRRVNKKQTPEEVLRQNKEEMVKVAERAALRKCFREGLGFTEFNDIVIDELNRPIDEEKLYCA